MAADKRRSRLSLPYKWQAFLVVSLGIFTSTLDSGILSVAFPILTGVFHTTPAAVAWANLSYILVSAGLMLTAGRLGDMLGRKRVYLVGMAIYGLGLVFSAAAQSLGQLILARSLQGIGHAMISTMVVSIITDVFPPEERGKALGTSAAVVASGLGSGPLIGGFLLEILGWRSIFYLRVPMPLLCLILGWRVLRMEAPASTRLKVDYLGAAAMFLALGSLLFTLSQGPGAGWPPTYFLLAFLAILSFSAFLLIESKVPQPILDLSLFRSRLFSLSATSLVLHFLAMMFLTFLMPFYLVQARGYPPVMAGLFMTSYQLVFLVISPIAGRLSDRMGFRLLCSTGMALEALALFLCATVLRLDSSAWLVFLILGLGGLGVGLFQPPNNSALMGSAPRERSGTAAGVLSVGRQLGLSIGTALASAFFTQRQLALAGTVGGPMAALGAFNYAVVFGALFAVLGIATSLARTPRVISPGPAQAKGQL